jgi:hypothetical protein
MIQNLVFATAMVGTTVIIHFCGLVALMWLLRHRAHRFRTHESIIGQCALIVLVVLGIFAIHTVEIWLYALVFQGMGAVPDFETALYFSTVNFSTLGYGDVLLEKQWRVFGAIEAANGLIMFGWSTAFLISVIGRMRMLEHDWLEGKSP